MEGLVWSLSASNFLKSAEFFSDSHPTQTEAMVLWATAGPTPRTIQKRTKRAMGKEIERNENALTPELSRTIAIMELDLVWKNTNKSTKTPPCLKPEITLEKNHKMAEETTDKVRAAKVSSHRRNSVWVESILSMNEVPTDSHRLPPKKLELQLNSVSAYLPAWVIVEDLRNSLLFIVADVVWLCSVIRAVRTPFELGLLVAGFQKL